MIIFPAIDLKDGKCVRLFQGDYSTATEVAADYLATANGFATCGAEWIHMVDLDAAKTGIPVNEKIVLDVADKCKLKVEIGGGIRTFETASMYLEQGIERVVIGSAAIENIKLVEEIIAKYGEDRIAIGIDVKDEYIAVDGWTKKSNVNMYDLIAKMCGVGVKYFIYTDIYKDGTLSQPNHNGIKKLVNFLAPYGAEVIASGGVRTITNLMTLKKNGAYGAICGKSLYSGTLDLKTALSRCSAKG